MAKKFQTSTLVLTKQELTANTQNLFLNNQAYPFSLLTGLLASGYPTLTGQVTLTGANIVKVFTSGNFIFFSGDTSSLATIANLYSTGSTLDTKINSLSGAAGIVYTTGDQTIRGIKTFSDEKTIITGRLGVGDTNPSYKVDATEELRGNDSTISIENTDNTHSRSNAVFLASVGGDGGGNPSLIFSIPSFNTWSVLEDNSDNDSFQIINNDVGLTRKTPFIITTGGIIDLYSPQVEVSGNLTVSGQVKIVGGAPGTNKVLTSDANGLATWQYPAASGSALDVSGALSIRIGATGSQLYNYSSDISGNLATTGSRLAGLIDGLSGQLNQTGSTLDSKINTLLLRPTVTGISITGSNSITGLVNLTGTSGVSLLQNGNTIIFEAGDIIKNLASTGSNLYNFSSSISGNLQTTGQSLINLVNGLSGQLVITGSNLYSFFSSISGNLAQTGSDLSTRIDGIFKNTVTGSGLYNVLPIWVPGGTGLGNSTLSETSSLLSTTLVFQPLATARFQGVTTLVSGLNTTLITSVDQLRLRTSGINSYGAKFNLNGGTNIGDQKLIYCDSGIVTWLNNGNALLNGDWIGNSGDKIKAMWNGTLWMEEYRYPPQTGSLTGLIVGLAGGVTGISITGGNSITGLISITGAGTVTTQRNGNVILISGNSFSGIRTFSSVSNMTGDSFYQGENCILNGYYSGNDGGFGIFQYLSGLSSPSDSGIVFPIQSQSGRLIRQFSGPINPKWFGAKGDGTTDDTLALNASLSYVRGLTNPSILFFPAGNYITSGSLLIDIPYITIYGEGEQASLISTNSTENLFIVKCDNATFENFGLVSRVANTGSAISMQYVKPVYVASSANFRNLQIMSVGGVTKWGNGIKFENPIDEGTPFSDGKWYSSYNVLQNLNILSFSNIGIDLSQSNIVVNTTTIQDCNIQGLTGYVADGSIGLKLRQWQSIASFRNIFQTVSKGISVAGETSCETLLIEGNYFEDFSHAGIEIGASDTNVTARIACNYFTADSINSVTGACILLTGNYSGPLDMSSNTLNSTSSTKKAVIAKNNPRCWYFNGFKDQSTAGAYDLGDISPINYLYGKFAIGGTGLIPTYPCEIVSSGIDEQPLCVRHIGAVPTNFGIALRADNLSANSATRNWAMISNNHVYGDFAIVQSSTQGTSPTLGNTRMRIDPIGNTLCFGGISGFSLTGNKFSVNAGEQGYFSGGQNLAEIFYPRNNPSGFITFGQTGIVYTTGAQTIFGTKTFSSLLHLSGVTDVNNGLLKITSTGDDNAGISLWCNAQTPNVNARSFQIAANYQNWGQLDILSSTSTGGNPTNPIMAILSSGKVGIRTISPASQLDVRGGITGINITGYTVNSITNTFDRYICNQLNSGFNNNVHIFNFNSNSTQIVNLTGVSANVFTFSGAGMAAGKELKALISSTGIITGIYYPSEYTWINQKPTGIPASGKCVLSMVCTGTLDNGVWCSWGRSI